MSFPTDDDSSVIRVPLVLWEIKEQEIGAAADDAAPLITSRPILRAINPLQTNPHSLFIPHFLPHFPELSHFVARPIIRAVVSHRRSTSIPSSLRTRASFPSSWPTLKAWMTSNSPSMSLVPAFPFPEVIQSHPSIQLPHSDNGSPKRWTIYVPDMLLCAL